MPGSCEFFNNSLYVWGMTKKGIYAIINLKEGRSYYGASTDIYRRKTQHKDKLINNRHFNAELQKDWNEQKGEQFKFAIIEEVTENLYEAEAKWILANPTCYNKGCSDKEGKFTYFKDKNPDRQEARLEKYHTNREMGKHKPAAGFRIREIVGVNKDKEEKFFNSIEEAAAFLGSNRNKVQDVLLRTSNPNSTKGRASHKGWVFYYKETYKQKSIDPFFETLN